VWRLLFMVAGCSSATPWLPLDGAPQQLGIDVTVSHAGVQIFVDGSDQTFPQVGGIGYWGDDEIRRFATDLEVGGSSYPLWSDVIGRNAVLVLQGQGCSARIPLGSRIPPQPRAPIAIMDLAASTISLTWDASPQAETTVLGFFNGWGGELWHVVGNAFTFAPSTMVDPIPVSSYRTVSVWTFATLDIVATDYGVVRVWTGDQAYATLYVRGAADELVPLSGRTDVR